MPTYIVSIADLYQSKVKILLIKEHSPVWALKKAIIEIQETQEQKKSFNDIIHYIQTLPLLIETLEANSYCASVKLAIITPIEGGELHLIDTN